LPVWVRVLLRTAWAALAVVLVTLGVIGVLVMPIGLLVFWGLLALVVGIAVWKAAITFPSVQQLVEPRKPDVWTGTAAALGFVVVCLAIAGLVTVVDAPTATAVLGVVLVGSSWLGWRLWRGTYAAPADVVAPTAAPDRPPTIRPPTMLRTLPIRPTRDLPTDELCLVWRRSYFQLQRAADEHTRQQIIRARQECLDELERRDSPGFARWLASGARAGSDPGRFLNSGG
jgi:hypothetical protein